jgi:serine/threonine protein kinase
MGEVFHARDTRLGREVAIKFSSDQFSERFEREARAIAALNHPLICHRPTLADRLVGGPLPLDEALTSRGRLPMRSTPLTREGSFTATSNRANIKVKPDGTVKVLDFGLAKIGSAIGPAGDNSPTFTSNGTQAGVILGTAAYMSPEQAKARSSISAPSSFRCEPRPVGDDA